MISTQPSRWVRYAFAAALFMAALTGFAQMPIFKRYYIADIPGLGWLDQFYTTYALHHLSAFAIVALAAYLMGNYLLLQRKTYRLTVVGYLRGALLAFILLSGGAVVYSNLPGYRFSPSVAMVLNLLHLGLVVIYLFAGLAAGIAGRRWLGRRA